MAKNKNEAKIKFTAETGEFNEQIKKSNNSLSELKAELKLNEAQMKTTGASVEGLEKKHQILSDQLKASESKTEALSQKVDKAAEIYGENSDEVQKLKVQLLNAQTAEEKVRQAIDACNNELEQQKSAANQAESATDNLTSTIDRQQSELNKLKKEYSDAVLQYGETSDEAKTLERSIGDLSGELKRSKAALADAADKADELDRSLDKVEDSSKDAGDGFTVLKGAVADLASDAIQGAVGKLGEFISYLGELPEATRELRQDMSTLTTSFDEMGFSTETAKNTWRDLYAVFGEDDRAVETANNISKMAKSQQDLDKWVTITTGVWGTYQDSLPVEALAESANETVKTGSVTGNLADALNWSSEAASMFSKYMSDDVTTAEDAFNVALSECTTEQERQTLITDTLTKLYGGAAETYRETAGSQMEAKEATADNIAAEAELAETIEPVTTAFTNLKTELLTAFQPAIEKVSTAMTGALEWAREHPVAMKAIGAAVGVLAAGLSVLIAVVTAYTIVQWAMNSAILANPMTWVIMGVVAAIAAVVAIIVVVVEYWDEIVAAVKRCWESVKATLAQWGSWIKTNVIDPVVNFFKGLWESIKSIWDTISNVVKVAIMFIGSILKAAFDIITLPFRFIWENCKEYVFAAWEWIKKVISTAINAVKGVISKVMNAIKTVFSTVWNAIKNVVMTVWNAISGFITPIVNKIKSVVTTAWNGIKNAITNVVNAIKTKVSSVFNSVKSSVSSVFNGIKSTASNVWNGIKNAIVKPIEAAKDKIKGIIDKIKGFFDNLKLKFPKIKMPHFTIKGKFSLDPPSVPKLAIDWYKEGGILTKPTIFGVNGNRLMAGGEAGAEAVLPIDKLEGYISGAIEKTMNVVNMGVLATAIENLASRPNKIYINGREVALATASDGDSINGIRSVLRGRGLAVE